MKTEFIQIVITNTDSTKSTRFINRNHIRQIFEKNGVIIIELTEYDSVTVTEVSIDAFMDRFIHL